MIDEKQAGTAARKYFDNIDDLDSIKLEEFDEGWRAVPVFKEHRRGAGALVIRRDGEMLLFPSAISRRRVLEEFDNFKHNGVGVGQVRDED